MRALRMIVALLVSLLPAIALAYSPGDPWPIDTGVNTTIPQIVSGIVNVFVFWSTLVTTAIFLVGALVMVGSGGGPQLDYGKKAMKSALIAYAIILGSWLILSTVVFFIAG